MIKKKYDCIVVGSGHAGCEAALASSKMGCKTLMINLRFDTIGEMSCNPAIGGVGKGQLVKEIDALGGAMGIVADKSAIQFRLLNSSKGQAVRSSRCQADRELYKKYMQELIKSQDNLGFLEDKVVGIIVKNNTVKGVETLGGGNIYCTSLVVAAGTFLDGRIHIGPKITEGGRINEENSSELARSMRDIGLEMVYFKTGTPPRIDGKTIDFSKMQAQYSDNPPVPFSFRTKEIPRSQKLLPCHITHTSLETFDIIKANMHLSPMYSGQIHATGVRYCPSIEDKLKKFPDKKTHQVFLEPEGLDTDIYYPNGISTGLPGEVQEKFVRTIKGLENVKITRYGYSIEHGVVPPTGLKPSLETKKINNLFLAGQINGTTGYEEAAGQGIVAGINAALKVKGKDPFILRRDESYIGVLIDDLVTKGTEEPYRMFTSRVEYRLIVREDNADKRMADYAYKFGLIKKKDYDEVKNKYQLIDKQIKYLESTKIRPNAAVNNVLKRLKSSEIRKVTSLSDLLKRPEMSFAKMAEFDEKITSLPKDVVDQIEYEIKYEGFIIRQKKDVEKFRHIENIKIPKDINYDEIHSLSKEIKQKLKYFTPQNLGQANRISGVTPASISILMVYLKNKNYAKEKVKRNEQ